MAPEVLGLSFSKGSFMKSLFVCLTVFCLGFSAVAGVDSSGGSIGGSLQISSGFSPGAFSISMFSPKSGTLETIRKYFVLAGAKENISVSGSDFELENNSIFLISSKFNTPDGLQYYQLNLTLPYQDLYDVSSSPQTASLSFRGPLALILYQAMEKSGAKSVGQNIDSQTGQVVGQIFLDESLLCQKSSDGGLRGGTWCKVTTHLDRGSFEGL